MFSFRNVVLFDAVTCLVMGVVLALAASPLASWTLIPEALLFYAGLVLLPTAAFMIAVARGTIRNTLGSAVVIGGNALLERRHAADRRALAPDRPAGTERTEPTYRWPKSSGTRMRTPAGSLSKASSTTSPNIFRCIQRGRTFC